MPCDDCKELHREVCRLRIILEQNFSAVLKRMDNQDKNMSFMMAIISEHFDGSTVSASTTPVRNSVDCNGCEIYDHRPTVFATSRFRRKRPRWLLKNVHPPNTRKDFEPTVISNVTHQLGPTENAFGDYTVGNTNFGNEHDALACGFYESDNREEGNLEESIVMDEVITECGTPDSNGDYEENETGEPSCDRDPPRNAGQNVDAPAGADGHYLEQVANATAHRFVSDDVNIGDFEVETESGNAGPSAACSTSGTACVTVRSAIRMEDLDRRGETASSELVHPLGDRTAAPTKKNTTGELLTEGQRFETMEDFLSSLHHYEQATGIALIVADSKKVETANKRLKPGSRPWDTKFKYVNETNASAGADGNEQVDSDVRGEAVPCVGVTDDCRAPKRKGGRYSGKRSAIWDHFDYDAVAGRSNCRHCNFSTADKHPGNLRKHLKKHPDAAADYDKKTDERRPIVNIPPASHSSVTTSAVVD